MQRALLFSAPNSAIKQTLRAQRLKKFKIARRGLKFSIEIANFKRANRQTPSFVGNFEGRDKLGAL